MAWHFTVQVANELLGTVRPLVERMVEQRREAVHQLERKEELTGLGVQIKDLDFGLVDFPSYHDGEEILLC
jgi:hypothetical protein